MKVLFDTNVILDLLLDRNPFVNEAELLFAYVEQSKITGIISATTLTTIHYLATKAVGIKNSRKQIDALLKLFDIAAVNRAVLEDAIRLPFADFEDAVLHEAARYGGAEVIVTRNCADFKKASLIIYTPAELLNVLVLES